MVHNLETFCVGDPGDSQIVVQVLHTRRQNPEQNAVTGIHFRHSRKDLNVADLFVGSESSFAPGGVCEANRGKEEEQER
jgi:hypothetical protein